MCIYVIDRTKRGGYNYVVLLKVKTRGTDPSTPGVHKFSGKIYEAFQKSKRQSFDMNQVHTEDP